MKVLTVDFTTRKVTEIVDVGSGKSELSKSKSKVSSPKGVPKIAAGLDDVNAYLQLTGFHEMGSLQSKSRLIAAVHLKNKLKIALADLQDLVDYIEVKIEDEATAERSS